jgi:hypothetical protein
MGKSMRQEGGWGAHNNNLGYTKANQIITQGKKKIKQTPCRSLRDIMKDNGKEKKNTV